MNTYEEHYNRCVKEYNSSEDSELFKIGILKNCLPVDRQVLSTVSQSVKKSLAKQHEISESKWGTFINDFSAIDGLELFCRSFVDQLEEKYFKSYVKIENLHILENKKDVPLESSWVWHYDDCPKQYFKFAIYLNEVTENSGPMQYISDSSGEAPVVESYRDNPNSIKGYPPPVFSKSRVPKKIIDSILNNGGKIETITGPAGTNFFFTPNIIHRGTSPKNNFESRLAMFLFVRPSLRKIENLCLSANPPKADVNVKKYMLD